jgi:hypothetical protein
MTASDSYINFLTAEVSVRRYKKTESPSKVKNKIGFQNAPCFPTTIILLVTLNEDSTVRVFENICMSVTRSDGRQNE